MIDRVEVAEMSGPALVALYNKLTGKAVKRFTDRTEGIKRVLAVLPAQAEAPAIAAKASKPVDATPAPQPAVGTPAVAQPSSKPAKAAPKAGKAAPVKPAVMPTVFTRTTAHAAVDGGQAPRPTSKRGLLLAALRTPKGMTLDEMAKRFSWKLTDCADALRLLAKKNGVAVACGEDGRWRVA